MSEFNPEPSQKIKIAGQAYKVMPHPMVPTFAFGQEGRKAFVYQLEATKTGRLYALKQFKVAYRHPELVDVCDALRQFANMQGLEVCIRECFSGDTHPDLLATYPDLAYAVLMPWIKGSTWYDIVVGMTPLSRDESLAYASKTALLLADLENKRLAHCDVSAPNVIINTLQGTVHLVDIEDLHAPGFQSPRSLPAGSEGYAHTTASDGLWSPEADRFATAVLLAEMLAWHMPEIRQTADEEHYFGVGEMQQDCDRYRLMRDVLHDISDETGQLFEEAWFSSTLSDCPPLALWHEELHRLTLPNPVKGWRPIVPGATRPKPQPATPPEPELVTPPPEEQPAAPEPLIAEQEPEPVEVPPPPEPVITEQEPEPMDVPPPPEPLPTVPIQVPATQTPQPPGSLSPAPPYSPLIGYRPLELPPDLFTAANGDEKAEDVDDQSEKVSEADAAPQLAQAEELPEQSLWTVARHDQRRLRPPRLSVATGAGDANRPTLVWTPIPGATHYVIQESNQPNFPSGRQVTIRDDTRWQSGPRPPGAYYYRVRGHKSGGRTPWSNTIRVDVGPD